VAGGSREDTAPGLGALGLFIAALIVVRVVLKLVGSDALTLALPVISLALVIGAIVWTAVAQRPVTEAAANPH
jgi:hypothetical protein